MRKCARCSAPIEQRKTANGPWPTYCTATCKWQAAHERARESGAYAHHVAAKRAKYEQVRHQHACTECGEPFESRLTQAKYCGATCSRRAYSQRRKADGRMAAYYQRNRDDLREKNRAWRERAPEVPCSGCGVLVRKTHGNRGTRVCSMWCREYVKHRRWPQSPVPDGHPSRSSAVPPEHPARQAACDHCAEAFAIQWAGQKFCTKKCAGRAHARRRDARKRAGRPLDREERVTPLRVYERDGWRCYLCRRRVKRDAVVPHRLAPTIDHVIPLSKGGRDDMANARTAHFRCNYEKSDRGGGEQLALIG